MKIKSIDETIHTFKNFRTAVADSCSLIYMEKAGFLKIAVNTIKLHVPRPILEETGFTGLPVKVYDVCKTDNKTVDMLIVDLAKKLKIPVISEDKAILERISKTGLHFYNAAMVLNLLLYKREVNYDKFVVYEKRLLRIAHYSEMVIRYSSLVTDKVLELYSDIAADN